MGRSVESGGRWKVGRGGGRNIGVVYILWKRNVRSVKFEGKNRGEVK